MRFIIECADCDFRSFGEDADHACSIIYYHEETGHTCFLETINDDDEEIE